jgi:hypothetical protein
MVGVGLADNFDMKPILEEIDEVLMLAATSAEPPATAAVTGSMMLQCLVKEKDPKRLDDKRKFFRLMADVIDRSYIHYKPETIACTNLIDIINEQVRDMHVAQAKATIEAAKTTSLPVQRKELKRLKSHDISQF